MLIKPRIPPGLGKAFWVAVLIVLSVELALHSESAIHRYRSVYAVGRAIDKLHYVEQRTPRILFVGNSRTDNGVDPRAVGVFLDSGSSYGFNLGLPGANFLIQHGIVKRLAEHRLLGGEGVRAIVLGLDESALQEDNSLGYASFLADREALWEEGLYKDWLGTFLRLWSYNGNLRQLREPEKSMRFVQATFRSLEPVGGGAATHLGYRAGFGAAQNEAQVTRQENAAQHPPSPTVVSFLWRTVDILESHGVQVVVTIPPLRDRPSAFFDPSAASAPYRELLGELRQRGVIVLPMVGGFSPSEFVNAGHLNDRGAQRYSAELGRQLQASGVH